MDVKVRGLLPFLTGSNILVPFFFFFVILMVLFQKEVQLSRGCSFCLRIRLCKFGNFFFNFYLKNKKNIFIFISIFI